MCTSMSFDHKCTLPNVTLHYDATRALSVYHTKWRLGCSTNTTPSWKAGICSCMEHNPHQDIWDTQSHMWIKSCLKTRLFTITELTSVIHQTLGALVVTFFMLQRPVNNVTVIMHQCIMHDMQQLWGCTYVDKDDVDISADVNSCNSFFTSAFWTEWLELAAPAGFLLTISKFLSTSCRGLSSRA